MINTRSSRAAAAGLLAGALALVMAGCASNDDTGSATGSSSAAAPTAAKVAFLMPDQGSTRYEEHDRPGFEARMKELCPDCTVLYNNADGDAAKQQQQFNAAITAGAKAIVLDAVDTSAAASLVQQAQSQGIKVVAYDRPIPDTPADFYVSYDNQKIGQLIASSLVKHMADEGISPDAGGVLQVNGSPTDAAAGLIKKGMHEGLATGKYKTLAEYDVPDWTPAKAQTWVSGQITRFGDKILGVNAANDGTAGGSIAAFKAAGVDPVPPVSGNDAIDAALQYIISGDQYNTISKPSEVVGAAAADAVWAMLQGKTPEKTATLFNTPSQLFVPVVVTRDNIKAEIFDKGIAQASTICTGEFAAGCQELGIK